MSDSGFLFTSESVTEGHPDKIADQISDAVLDAALTEDPYSRVACETLLTTGLIVVAGEITTSSTIDYAAVARRVVNEIGYDNGEYYFDGNAVGVLVAMDRQSPDIAQGVDTAHEGRVTGSEDPLDKIGAGEEINVALIQAVWCPDASRHLSRVGLVIAGIDDCGAVYLKAVAECQRRVVQVVCSYSDVADREYALDQLMVANGCGELFQQDRKIGVLHLPGEGFTHRLGEAMGCIDVPLVAGHKQRGKKWPALDVVPVRMADQHMAAQRPHAAFHQRFAQLVSTGSTVDDDEGTGCRPYLDAGCVAAVSDGARSRLGNRAPGTPEANMHGRLSCRTGLVKVGSTDRHGKATLATSVNAILDGHCRGRRPPVGG